MDYTTYVFSLIDKIFDKNQPSVMQPSKELKTKIKHMLHVKGEYHLPQTPTHYIYFIYI